MKAIFLPGLYGLMQKIRTTSISEGQTFDYALFLPSGQKLQSAGVAISKRLIQTLFRLSENELVLASSLQEMVDAGLVKPVNRGRYRVGRRAEHDLIGSGGHVLVETGEEIEQHHLDALGEGGYASSDPQPKKPDRHDRLVMADATADHMAERIEEMNLRVRPQEMQVWDYEHIEPITWPDADTLARWRSEIVEQLRGLYSQVESGLAIEADGFNRIVDRLYRLMITNRTRFAQLALMCPRQDNYLPDHALCVSVLAMQTAAQLVWDVDQVKTMGLAGLVFDLGMLLVPQRILTGGCELTDIDRNRIHRHPVYSVVMMESITGMPDVVKVAAYQHHERENGAGYPAGTRGENIADVSRVLSAADVFAAASSPRHYRHDRLPYMVMEEIIRSAAANTYHRVSVRALVQAAGLFPVGSWVKLSNNRMAQVLAANPNHLDRPVVQVYSDELTPISQPIDLSQVPVHQLAVVRPAPAPEQLQTA